MADPRPGSRWKHLALAALPLLAGYLLVRPRPRTSLAALDGSPGEPGAGGYYGVWPRHSPDAEVAAHIEMQYAGMRHQEDAALSGMWLFLATELLFFGGLFLAYVFSRNSHPDAFAAASAHAQLAIGTINTVLLLTSSATYAYGHVCSEHGDNRRLLHASIATAAIGTGFLLLKAWEWKLDFDEHLFPGPTFASTGPDPGGMQLFWSLYFVATALHALHMIIGLGLIAMVARNAKRNIYQPGYTTPVAVVGLYWTFVDMIWLLLYPMIYLARHAT